MEDAHIVCTEDDNSYPDCLQCGVCCGLNLIAMTRDEVLRIHAYMDEHGIVPIDRGKDRCCLQAPDGRCMVWPARSQTCRLHHCWVPRERILHDNPSIVVPPDEDLYLVDMHDHFIGGDFQVHRFAELDADAEGGDHAA